LRTDTAQKSNQFPLFFKRLQTLTDFCKNIQFGNIQSHNVDIHSKENTLIKMCSKLVSKIIRNNKRMFIYDLVSVHKFVLCYTESIIKL